MPEGKKREYDVNKQGPITAIRITEEGSSLPQAVLVFAHGGSVTITWTNIEQREKYAEGINGYTLIYDERTNKIPFDSLLKKPAW